MNDLARLFDDGEPPWPYHDFDEEMAAVQRGEKAISMVPFPMDAVENNDESYLALVQSTLAAGLTLAVHQSPLSIPLHQHVNAFAYREGESWRVPALLATEKVLRGYPPWSDGLEALESCLLGYSEEQIVQWIDYQRARRLGWVGRTVYALMTREQQRRIVEHGSRSFPDGPPADEMLLLFVSRRQYPIRRDAAEQCGPMRALARFAMAADGFDTLFKNVLKARDSGVVSVEIPARDGVSLNKFLESRIEFLSPDFDEP